MVGKIACFLTCGYSEAGYMQNFLRKINENYIYKQYLPNKTIKKKGMPKNISKDYSGLSGEALQQKIYEIIRRHRDEIATCNGIIVEDDLDGRFHQWTKDEIQADDQRIKENIYEILQVEIPIIILYASPEIEAWFVADWRHGFGYLYTGDEVIHELDKNTKEYFEHELKKYVEEKVLKQYANSIEDYGYFEGKYKKLSDELIRVVQEDIKLYIEKHGTAKGKIVNDIVTSRELFYSKKLHGGIMLRKLEPDVLERKCTIYFKEAYHSLKEM